MPRLSGADARHYWVAYTSDVKTGSPATNVLYKVQVSQRHIHWLKAMGFTNSDLELDSGKSYRVGSGTVDMKPRAVHLSNGTKKRRTVMIPDPASPMMTLEMSDPALRSYAFTLDGETGTWRITGRRGEKQSRAVDNYNGS